MKPLCRASAISAVLALLGGVVLSCPEGAAGQGLPKPPAQSQTTPLPQPAPAPLESASPDLVAPAAPGNYVIGPDDLLSIYVFQVPAMTREVMVDRSGGINLPFLARSILAGGRTAAEVADAISQALAAAGLVRHPLVQVIVREVLSKPIVVGGAVMTPQTLQASRPMTLLEVLSRAGGLAQNAGDTAVISSLSSPNKETARVALGPLYRGDPAAADPPLDGGEMVRVVPAGQVIVVGALKQPGAFYVQAGHPITVLGAIALAHGIKDPAHLSDAQILHRGAGPRAAVKAERIDVDRILKHKAPDPTLAVGDILYIPANGARTVLSAILADAGQAAVIAIGYH